MLNWAWKKFYNIGPWSDIKTTLQQIGNQMSMTQELIPYLLH